MKLADEQNSLFYERVIQSQVNIFFIMGNNNFVSVKIKVRLSPSKKIVLFAYENHNLFYIKIFFCSQYI